MQINYPAQVDTDLKKIKFLFRLIEIFRLGHNFIGYWWKTGFISETQWNNTLDNNVPAPVADWVRNRYIYHSQLSDNEWSDFRIWYEDHFKWIMYYRNIQMQIFFDENTNDSIVNINGVLT